MPFCSRKPADDAEQRHVRWIEPQQRLYGAFVDELPLEIRGRVARTQYRIDRRIPHGGVDAVQDPAQHRARWRISPSSPQPNCGV